MPEADPPPSNIEVLIYAPDVLYDRWFRAIRTEVKGRRGLRWRIFDYPGKSNSVIAGKQFEPQEWMPIPPPSGAH
jgi:hypothetical protein